MEYIHLYIRNREFHVRKEMLCEHSDYFRAMFSGNYIEKEQKEIHIDLLDPDTMELIVNYMIIGVIDLTEYDFATLCNISNAATFLQITELIKQMEYTLDMQLCESNWIETMMIAEQCIYSKLRKLAVTYGLFAFKKMKVEYIPLLNTLAWYLSHPYLDSENELNVFKFGFNWLQHNETGADAILIILGCLDLNKLSVKEINEIRKLISVYEYSLALKVVECVMSLINRGGNKLDTQFLKSHKQIICQEFTERVYIEVQNLVENCPTRKLTYTPIVPMWILKDSRLEMLPQCLYSYTEEKKFEKWLEVAEKNLWGWSAVNWSGNNLVVVCGEHGRGTGLFMQDVKVYDLLRQVWVKHGVQLPPRRHGGMAVVGDELFIIGGVGTFRVVLDTAIAYDLKRRSFRKIAKFPDAIQSPGVCSHQNKVYVTGHRNIYCYEDRNGFDEWKCVVQTNIRMSCMRSFKKHIYGIQSFFSQLYRFQPGVDSRLECITTFTHLPATICDLGDRLVVFTRTIGGCTEDLSVEEYTGKADEKPKLVYTQTDTTLRVNEFAGSCEVVLTNPPTEWELSDYLQRYLKRYE
ncbi:unnamed protein product [Leptidea sinapis]|uniref:BTB domain-containing protein n=1 Tax=Leptidea sinapis TaxID=189913 RepID=A0A5E4Q1Q9_9NEOP|nr:unnamed protein product [Leptidea sinapis]